MLFKILSLPFLLVSGLIKLLARLIGLVLSLGTGTVRLVANRLFGVIFGALIGFFLGKGHIGIKLFRKRKK
jgi:hypothetical protein